ncbi:MAG: metal-dependent hydrolase [Candidatus Woesearchaeota archaeon]
MLTLTHIVFGLLLGKITGNMLYVLLGSTIIDLDHYFQFKKEGALKSWKKFWQRCWHPPAGKTAKHPIVHSLTGWLIFMNVALLINQESAIYFGLGYLGHLLLDLFDTSQKRYFWPLNFIHKGPLKFNTLTEYIIIAIIVLLLFFL